MSFSYSKMSLKVIILCCVLQSIAGVKIPNLEIEHQSIDSRIVGGHDAAEGQAPYQCSLQMEYLGHFCGCAIVSSKYLVTAAHCLEGRQPSEIKIVVGTNKWNSGGATYKAEKFIVHEQHNSPQFAYDIGLIQVPTPIRFNEKVQPIKLSKEFIEGRKNLMVTGWGYLQDNGDTPIKLQVLNLTSIANNECNVLANAHDSHLCTLSPRGKGICNGDSGGPLVYENELVGIVNWGISCAIGMPDGFARISYLYDWIEENMNSE